MHRRNVLFALAAVVLLAVTPAARADEDLTVTKERRAAIAKAAPEAKKFVLAEDLLATALKKKPGNAKELEAAWDKVAKGKWILFTSSLSSVGSEGFMINFSWGEGDPYRETLLIKVAHPKGYDAAQRSLGPRYPMLVKYKSARSADPAYDLIGVGAWK